MWSEAAVNGSEEMLFNAETVTFSPKINLNGHFFGDVVVKLHSGKSAKLSYLLYKTNASMNPQNFLHGKFFSSFSYEIFVSMALTQVLRKFVTQGFIDSPFHKF